MRNCRGELSGSIPLEVATVARGLTAFNLLRPVLEVTLGRKAESADSSPANVPWRVALNTIIHAAILA